MGIILAVFKLEIPLVLVPREARAEGPSVARLINQSGRRPERSESRANSSEKYIYIHIYIPGFLKKGSTEILRYVNLSFLI